MSYIKYIFNSFVMIYINVDFLSNNCVTKILTIKLCDEIFIILLFLSFIIESLLNILNISSSKLNQYYIDLSRH